jgi:hypothetical protein
MSPFAPAASSRLARFDQSLPNLLIKKEKKSNETASKLRATGINRVKQT